MSTVDYQLYAEADDANVVTQAVYVAAAWRLTGFVPGLAQSAEANKVWRQSSFMATALATFVSQQLGVDVLDDGDISTFVANLISAMGLTARPARVVTASATLNVAVSDYAVGLNRTTGLANMTVNLPASAQNGQEFVVDDLSFSFDAYPVTFAVPGGTTFSGGGATYVVNERGATCLFRFYAATNQWKMIIS